MGKMLKIKKINELEQITPKSVRSKIAKLLIKGAKLKAKKLRNWRKKRKK
jgi:hypothetical protein